MLHNLKKRNSQKGFTIIEVMIVLAIAGLIMLVVFLAVPALQRSSRNTQRKNDVSAIASTVANYIDNNGGTLPKGYAASGVNLVVCNTGTTCTGSGLNTETAKLGYYAPGNVKIITSGKGTTTLDAEHVEIVDGYACDDTSTAVGNASSRSAAIHYAVETNSSGGTAQQCTEQ